MRFLPGIPQSFNPKKDNEHIDFSTFKGLSLFSVSKSSFLFIIDILTDQLLE